MIHVVFVAPFLLEATLRFVKGAAVLPGVRLSLITQDPPTKIPEEIGSRIEEVRRIENALDADQLASTILPGISWPRSNSCRCLSPGCAPSWASPEWTCRRRRTSVTSLA